MLILLSVLGAGTLSTVPGAAARQGASSPRFTAAADTPSGLVGKPSLEALRPQWVEGQILVQWNAGVSRAAAGASHLDLGARVLHRIADFGGIDVVALPPGVTVAQGLRSYARDPRVAVAEPNLVRSLAGHVPAAPDDQRFGELWGLHNTGQEHRVSRNDSGVITAGGTGDADIDAPEAWAREHTGEPVIAVIDSGANIAHEDLAGQLWVDPATGLNGWNFSGSGRGNGDLSDSASRSGHGTHVAGTIAAAAGNGVGIAGVCPQCRVMVVKTDLTLANLLKAFAFARNNGAHIVNGSFGGGLWSALERRAIQELGAAGVLAVFSAGNEWADNDLFLSGPSSLLSPEFPASYALPNIISVAASNHNDRYGYSTGCAELYARWQCAFTSFGHDSVDLAAPGVDIHSLSKRGNSAYVTYDGTSMAAPHVAGVAGLVKSAFPGRTPAEIKNAIMNGVDKPGTLGTMYSPLFGRANATGVFTRTGGRLNADGALVAPTTGATTKTDGNVNGAKSMTTSHSGAVTYPHDVNDVWKKRLIKGARYRL
ncbi:MAG: S8 family serine peptidase, partial [Actinomycetota bacterium]|nr:S8 family serine peptidase [Actinomycetota bacterium]